MTLNNWWQSIFSKTKNESS